MPTAQDLGLVEESSKTFPTRRLLHNLKNHHGFSKICNPKINGVCIEKSY